MHYVYGEILLSMVGQVCGFGSCRKYFTVYGYLLSSPGFHTDTYDVAVVGKRGV